MQYGYSPFCKVYVDGFEPAGMSVAVGPLAVGPLTASVAVGVAVGFNATSGVDV